MIKEANELMIRGVKFADESFFTMDDYDYELTMDDCEEDEVWQDEDDLEFSGVPDDLWTDWPTNKTPPEPEAWVDRLADEVEVNRLMKMGVLQGLHDYEGKIGGKLTVKSVYDWRLKMRECTVDGCGVSKQQWMRRRRLVAREFNNSKRADAFSPATGCRATNLIPLLYLRRIEQLDGETGAYPVVLAALDVKDAFLQVPQEHIFKIRLNGQEFAVLKNLPGQRLGAKQWYWFFRKFATNAMQFEWCSERPCLARRDGNVFIMLMICFSAVMVISGRMSSCLP